MSKQQGTNVYNVGLRSVGVIGVYYMNLGPHIRRGERRPFATQIEVGRKRIQAGRYADPVSAAKAYNTYAEIYGGKLRNSPEVIAALEDWWKRKGRPL
jgi:hypothetical protein